MERVFTVPAGPAAVWGVVGDLGGLVECLPALTQPEIDGSGIGARLRLRVGSNQVTYVGRLDLRTADEQDGLIELDGAGSEARGAGEVSASVRIRLQRKDSGTEVTVRVTAAGSGRIDGFDPEAVREAGGRLLDRFVEAVTERVPADDSLDSVGPESAPVEVPASVSPPERPALPEPPASPVAPAPPVQAEPAERPESRSWSDSSDSPDEPDAPLATVTSIAGAVAVRSQARRGAAASVAALAVAILALWFTRRRGR